MSEKVIINVETDKETVDQLIHAMKTYAAHVEDGIQENLIKLLQGIEAGVERKCVYNLLVDSGGDAWETDYYSNCGTSYPSDVEFEQPGTGHNIYCWKCAGRIEVVKEVVSDGGC